MIRIIYLVILFIIISNSVSVSNLLRLGHIIDDTGYDAKAEQTLKYFSGKLNKVPYAMSAMVANLMLHLKGIKQVFFK